MPEESERKNYDFETTTVGGNLYNVELLEREAEQIQEQEIELDKLKESVSEHHRYWNDLNGEWLGPFQILENWEEAQKNNAWLPHIENIKQANVDNPIWMTKDGLIFNGMHRLTRAFLEGKKTMKVKVFENLPDSAIIGRNE